MGDGTLVGPNEYLLFRGEHWQKGVESTTTKCSASNKQKKTLRTSKKHIPQFPTHVTISDTLNNLVHIQQFPTQAQFQRGG